MTGSQISFVRTRLGLDPFAFAAVLGVHVSSIYRWEKEGGSAPRIDPLQLSIIDGLHKRLKQSAFKPKAVGEDLGVRVKNALVSGGSLAGLFAVLQFLVEGETHA